MKHVTRTVPVIALALAAFAPAVAAQGAPGTVAQLIVVEPLNGHAVELEEGVRTHMDNMRKAGETWTWTGFEVVMGERTGSYVWGSFNHQYADWDSPDVDPQTASASIDRNIAPHVENVRVSLANLRTDLSVTTEDRTIRPMYEVLTFRLKGGKDLQFASAVGMVKEAVERGGGGVEFLVYQFAQGSNGEWVISIPHTSFASMGTMNNDGFWAMMRDAHGEHGADTWQQLMDASVASMTSEIFQSRPDLSFN